MTKAANNSPTSQPQPAGADRRGASSFALKVAAIVGMTANHFCHVFADYLPLQATCALYGFGGLTFPIMAFLLVEGYRHTSNLRRYAQRLLVFALVSQIPYGLFLGTNLNVLFTLALSLGLLHLNDRMRNRAAFWLVAVAIVATSALCDWGIVGPAMVLMMQVLPDRRRRVVYPLLLPILGYGLPALADLAAAPALALLPEVLYTVVGCSATIPLLLAYNGQRGKPLKWFFYAYYPAHILALGLLRGLIFGDWTFVF